MISFFDLLNSPIFVVITSLLFGSILGSFANMLIYRLPLNKNIVYPNSFCPCCKHALSFRNLIPLFSYLFQKGKCSFCNKPITFRYFLVEVLYVLLFFGYLSNGSPIFLNHHLFLFSFGCIILFFTDIEHYILPVSLNMSIIVLGLVFSFYNNVLVANLTSTLIIVSILLLTRLVFNFIYKKDTFGLGDIILLAGISINWGWGICLMSFYFGAILGGTFSIGLILTKKKKRLDYIAFGPFLILGFFLGYLLYPILLATYFF